MTSWFARIVAGAALLSATAPARAQCGLLSWDEYRATRFELPYVFRAGNSGELLMFGARHTRSPRDPQIGEIVRLWREFRPQVAFSEGGIRPPAPNIDTAVARYGEPGVLRVLADRDRVELRNLEPPEEEEAAALARVFPVEQVKLFYALRMVSGLASEESSPDRRKQVALESVRTRRKLTGSPETPRELDAAVARLLPPFDMAGPVPPQWLDPSRADTLLNAICRRSSEYRNCHMVPLIVREVRAGRRVFVVVGGSHVVVQAPALRAALP